MALTARVLRPSRERFPEAGGGYVTEPAMDLPWILVRLEVHVVMDPGITAALAVGLAGYVDYVLDLSPLGAKAVAVGAVLVLAAVSILGVRLAAGFVQWLTLIKLGALALIIVLALVRGLGDWSNFIPLVEQRPGSTPLPGALAPALVGAFFAFGGWWEINKLAGETKDPARTLPRALALGVLTVTAVYILTSAVFLYLVPLERVTSGETFAAQAGEALFGRAGGGVFAAIVIVSVLGSILALLIALPRVYYAMARDGVFFNAIAELHPRFGTPARAIALQGTLASLLVVLGTFQQIVSYFVFITVLFVGLTVASLFVLRRGAKDTPVYRTPGYPITPVIS